MITKEREKLIEEYKSKFGTDFFFKHTPKKLTGIFASGEWSFARYALFALQEQGFYNDKNILK